jgi:hypothetical protein
MNENDTQQIMTEEIDSTEEVYEDDKLVDEVEDDTDTESDTESDSHAAETQYDSEDRTEEFDDEEFEYDEDGNIVIPDDESEEDAPESDDNSKDTIETLNASNVSEEAPREQKKDPRDEEIERLNREIRKRDFQIKETLKALGEDENKGIDGLEAIAAEASDQTLEEYREAKNKREQEEIQKSNDRAVKLDALKRADLAAVQAAYPEAKKYARVDDFPNFKRFAELRDMGASPEEAYMATHGSAVVSTAVKATKQTTLNHQNKDHLRSSAPKPAKDTSVKISRAELQDLRDLFPNMRDAEIIKLYKKTR